MNSSSLVSFQWASLEEARVELERAAGNYVIGGGGGNPGAVPVTARIQLADSSGTPPPLPPPPHAVTLYTTATTRPRKILGHMWVAAGVGGVVPRRMGAPQFQDSFIRLVEFVLGRLQREEQDTMRQDLMVSCVFHEIRNPLTGILNAVDLLLEGFPNASATATHNLKLIETNVSYLLQVTTDLLELFRISQNRSACKVTQCAPRSLLASSATLFPELRCVISVPESVPEFLTCDATKYKQILINLLSNSRKFKATEVTLRVAYRLGNLYTEIADNGPGVVEGEKTNLFKSLGKSTSGLGIGLFMCRKLAELMQGKITLKQNSEHGCTFALQFPVGAANPPATETPLSLSPSEPAPATTKALRILIADDHTAVRDTLAQMLQSFPAVSFTDTAFDGQDAVEKVKSAVAVALPYDWIFLDLKMPRKSGWQAAQEILGFGANRDSHPKIIFISAFALSATEKLASQQLGVRGFIQKPFRKADVVKIINEAS